MLKTTKTEFREFKKRCEYWLGKFGLTQYRVDYIHEDLTNIGAYACYTALQTGGIATITLSSVIDEEFNLEDSAKHECIHLLLHRIGHLARCRYLDRDDIEEELELLVRRLEKVIR